MKPRSRGIKLKWVRPKETKTYGAIVYKAKPVGRIVYPEEILARKMAQSLAAIILIEIFRLLLVRVQGKQKLFRVE